MTGHAVAFAASLESDGCFGDAAVERRRRVAIFVWLRNGHLREGLIVVVGVWVAVFVVRGRATSQGKKSDLASDYIRSRRYCCLDYGRMLLASVASATSMSARVTVRLGSNRTASVPQLNTSTPCSRLRLTTRPGSATTIPRINPRPRRPRT
jgi:hypothetical protein